VSQPAYLPPQPQPRMVRYQAPPPWWPLALVAGLLLLAAVGVAVLLLTNPSL